MPHEQFPDTAAWPQLGVSGRNAYRASESVVDMRRPVRPVRAARLNALPQEVVFDADRAALIIIDMQNDFCGDQGWIASMGIDVTPAQALAAPINAAADAFRSVGSPVLWVNWGVRPDRANLSPGTQHPFNPHGVGPGLGGERAGPEGDYGMLQQGGWGARVIDGLRMEDSDIRVDKQRISGFWDTPLDAILRNHQATTLFFAGVNADHCVLGTLMDANFHGYDTILLEDCTATTSPDFCMQATLHNVRFCFGFTATSRDLVQSMSRSA